MRRKEIVMRKELKEIEINEFSEAHFDFWKKGLLLVARSDDKANAMTIGWGGIGVMWGKPVAYVVVRPERFTHGLMESSEHYSICAMGDEYIGALSLCGSRSGRNTDKLAECGLTVESIGDAPYVKESELVITCRKLAAIPYSPEQLSREISHWYGAHGGYHTMYIGEIESILKR